MSLNNTNAAKIVEIVFFNVDQLLLPKSLFPLFGLCEASFSSIDYL